MRVLMLSSDPNMFDSGSAVFSRMRALASELGELNVIVLSAGSAPDPSDGPLRVFGVRTSCRLLSGLDAVLQARKLPRPDVVTVQDPFETGLAGLVIARLVRVPLHVQVHTDIGNPAFAALSVLNRIRVRIARLVLPRAGHVRAVSERVREGVLRLAPRVALSVLPVFVDVDRLRAGAHGGETKARFLRFDSVLLIVARLEKEKDVGLAIDAFANAAPPGACLVVVGDGRERARLEERARLRGVYERVFFEGHRDPASYFSVADLLLSTSRYEGYGMAVVEALSLGIPVLSTDVGVAREAGAVVASRDEFEDTLRAWFSSGERAAQLLVETPSLGEYAHRFAEDLRRCAQGGKRL